MAQNAPKLFEIAWNSLEHPKRSKSIPKQMQTTQNSPSWPEMLRNNLKRSKNSLN
jgi:hypothetical protein